MRYLVKARVKPGREVGLLRAIEDGTLGAGSVAGAEYLRNMQQARACSDGTTPVASARHGVDVVRVLTAIDASARQRGAPVAVT